MSKERELLKRIVKADVADYIDIINEAEEILAQHEQGFIGYLYKQKDCYGDWSVRFKVYRPYITSHEIKDIVPVYTAPPKQEPKKELMTDRDISRVYPDHYCAMEKEAFKIGVKWYEKYVARIGVYSNE